MTTLLVILCIALAVGCIVLALLWLEERQQHAKTRRLMAEPVSVEIDRGYYDVTRGRRW